MRNGRSNDYVVYSAFGGLLVLVVFGLVQLNRIEKKLIVQSQEIRALGEATDRLSRGGPVERAATETSAAEPMPAKVLHPDVPNFLKPRETHWPPQGATLDGTIVRGWASGDPKGFNPMIENAGDLPELIEAYAATPVADRNLWTNPDDWHAELATRVELTDDSKELTIYLRRGVKWHPVPNVDLASPKHAWLNREHEVTAQDLAFTFDIMNNPHVENGFLKSYLVELESWKAVDDYTFVVRWKKKQFYNIANTLNLVNPIPKFLFSCDEDGTPIPKETLGLKFNQHWYNNKGYVGYGPYRMVSYEPGRLMRFVRNEEFFGEKPAIKEIRYPIYTDPQQTLLKLKAHELSTGGLQPSQYREEIFQYEQSGQKPANSPFFDGRITCQKIDQPMFRYVAWNADRPIFADKRVRLAMTYAMNRQQMLEKIFVGLGSLTTGPFLKSSPYNDASIAPYPFDLGKAKELLVEAGWQDTDGDGLLDKTIRPSDAKRSPFEFTLLVYGSSKEYTALANILKEDLLKIGAKLNIDAAEWSLMQKRMEEKNFDAYTGIWGLDWESDLFQIYHSSQADIPKGSNRVGFRHKRADAIIEQLRDVFDPAERVRLAHEFHRIVHEEQPYSFFSIPQSVFCAWSDVKGIIFSKLRPVANTLPWWVAHGAN
jgi:peptide/nickel transport system substrate-binding protein